jgi:hypothetical protein
MKPQFDPGWTDTQLATVMSFSNLVHNFPDTTAEQKQILTNNLFSFIKKHGPPPYYDPKTAGMFFYTLFKDTGLINKAALESFKQDVLNGSWVNNPKYDSKNWLHDTHDL